MRMMCLFRPYFLLDIHDFCLLIVVEVEGYKNIYFCWCFLFDDDEDTGWDGG